MSIDLSVIIPAYNRVEMLKYTLESIHHAIQDLIVEIIVVDDGSQQPLSDCLAGFLNLPICFIRQTNQGSIVARNRGLREAKGKYIFFLDSDDIVHPEKFITQIAALEDNQADICYTDEASVKLQGDYNALISQPTRILTTVTQAAEFYLKVQPLPCNPIYRRSYLQKYLINPIVPENRIYDPVGDVWIYYNLAAYPAKITKVNGYYSIYGEHEEERYTNHWEKLGVASLALALTFIKNCPVNESTFEARRITGECALIGWRRLPKNFDLNFENKVLEIWQKSPQSNLENLGGKIFQTIAKIIGIRNAASIFRYFQRPDYSKIQTVTNEELKNLVASLENI